MYIRKERAVSTPDDVMRAGHRGIQPGQGRASRPYITFKPGPKGHTEAQLAKGLGKSPGRGPRVHTKRITLVRIQ